MKTILISSFNPFLSRNILATDALTLLKERKDLRVVILVPEGKGNFFRSMFEDGQTSVEEIKLSKLESHRGSRLALRLSHLFFDSHYLRYKRFEKFQSKGGAIAYLEYRLSNFIGWLSGRRPLIGRMFRLLDRWLSPGNFYSSLFQKYRPDLVVALDVFHWGDANLLREARLSGIKAIGMIRSWDNCWSKGILREIPNFLVVNNKILAEEAAEFHGVPLASIEIVGLPQFDIFVKGPLKGKEEFMSSVGADSKKALILFAPAGSSLSDTDADICKIILEGIKNGSFPKESQLYVRNHPHHPADLTSLSKKEKFILENPGAGFQGDGTKMNEFSKEEYLHLPNLLLHSDVVIYVATTLGLDSAALDRPQIMVNFDGYIFKPYLSSVRRYHDEDHMKKLIATKGVRMANSKEELISHISDYLKNPGLDHEGRERIRKEQLAFTDGKSGERLGIFILKHL